MFTNCLLILRVEACPRSPLSSAVVVNAETVTGSAKMFYYKQWIIYKQAIVYKNQYVSILQALEMLIPAKLQLGPDLGVSR